ncbi:MAG: hypothetical protein ACJ73S_22875, partial [Mycobacteriales bacterium]
TLGPRGALLATAGGGPARLLAAPYTAAGDSDGAGDRFAATAAVRLAAGDDVATATAAAVEAATGFVAGGGACRYGTAPPPPAVPGGPRATRLSPPAASGPVPALTEGSPR